MKQAEQVHEAFSCCPTQGVLQNAGFDACPVFIHAQHVRQKRLGHGMAVVHLPGELFTASGQDKEPVLVVRHQPLPYEGLEPDGKRRVRDPEFVSDIDQSGVARARTNLPNAPEVVLVARGELSAGSFACEHGASFFGRYAYVLVGKPIVSTKVPVNHAGGHPARAT